MITKSEARTLILQEWAHWLKKYPDKTNPNGTDGLIFFGYLQTERPALLRFRNKGDKCRSCMGGCCRRASYQANGYQVGEISCVMCVMDDDTLVVNACADFPANSLSCASACAAAIRSKQERARCERERSADQSAADTHPLPISSSAAVRFARA